MGHDEDEDVSGSEVEAGTSEAGEQTTTEATGAAAGTAKPRKKRRASDYILEQYASILIGGNGMEKWIEIQSGFVSPKTAWAFATKNKLEGVFRVVRVATEAYAFTLTPQEPVLGIEKVQIPVTKRKANKA
jgi:hypothetical protein